MAEDTVKFVINIEETIDDSRIEKIKNDIKKDLKEKKKKDSLPKRSDRRDTPDTTSRAPAPTSYFTEDRGGIFLKTDPPVKGFEKRQQIRGGVERLRDDRSLQPHQHEKWLTTIKRIEDNIEKNNIQFKALENFINNHISPVIQGSQAIQNPAGLVGDQLLTMLRGGGPYGVAVLGALGVVMSTAAAAEGLIKHLSQKGLPLNRDWKRAVEDEMNSLFSIEEKKRRLLGKDVFIVTQQDRYQSDSGSTTYNSLENRDEVIISKLGLAEKAEGII